MEVAIDTFQPPTEAPVFMMIDAADPRRESSRPPRSTAVHAKGSDEGHRAKPPVELVLYVSSISPHSTAALRNIRRALAKYSGSSVTLTVHDLSKDPQRAERDGVHFTPTLVTKGNGPRTWIVGHLGNPQVLQALLDSALEPPE
jgi:KaiB-like protein